MKNCIINIGHVDHFKQYQEDKNTLDLNMKTKANTFKKRKVLYLEGGHDVIEENPEEF